MKEKHGLSVYIVCLLSIFFILSFQTGFADDLDKPVNKTGHESYILPEPYVSTGFPQVVVVSGSNYEMGMQYGEQTALATVHNLAIFKSKLYSKVKGGEKTVTNDMRAWNYFLIKYDPTLKEWIDGIKQGCENMGYSVSYDDLVLIMVYPSELWSRPVNDYPPEITKNPGKNNIGYTIKSSERSYHSCNSFAATGSATPDGKPLHAITQMAETEMMNNIILIAFPETGYSFISQTFAGRVNANSAMNSNGFAWTMTAIPADSPAWGLTEVYFHYLAQIASSPTDAIKYLENTPRGGEAGGFIFSDAKGIEAFETNTSKYSIRSPTGGNGFLVQTNHLVDPDLASYNPVWGDELGTRQRYDTLYQFLKEAEPGSIDMEFAKRILASSDWFEKSKNTWHRNNPGVGFLSNDHTSVSESIFSPADLTAYLATGTPSGNGIPAYATGEYVKIKLATVPKRVVDRTDSDTIKCYWKSADLFEKEMNTIPTPGYLTPFLVEKVQELLDKSMTSYSIGIDRAAYAYLEKDIKKSNALWGAAMTHFAKAQLYAKMAGTALHRAIKGDAAKF